MSQLTIDIPTEIQKVMEAHSGIDWETIAQQSLLDYARRLTRVEQILEKSQFTESDAQEFDKRFKAGLAKRYRS
jgi:hypothetical protein